jgi:toxin ParE1/3/4
VPKEIILHEQARLDVERQATFLAMDSVELAIRFLDEFDRFVGRLVRFPRLGRAWPARDPDLMGLRRLVMTDFPLSIFYRAAADRIEIIRILHHRRDLPPELEGDL